ncbi:hypothetical protein [Mycobacterium sp. SA01]
MGEVATWAASASVKFREVQRRTESEQTRLLAEGLAHLAHAVRALDPDRP